MTDLAVKLLAGYLAEHYQRVKIMDYCTTYYDNCILVGDLRMCSHCKRTGETRRSDAKRGKAKQQGRD